MIISLFVTIYLTIRLLFMRHTISHKLMCNIGCNETFKMTLLQPSCIRYWNLKGFNIHQLSPWGLLTPGSTYPLI